MPLKLYNTLTRRKEEFKPLDRENVRMYVCGPTVYDYAHIGNARPVIVFDVLFRLLRHLYGADHVTYVRNITDVDDKINARAREEGVAIRDLTERTAKQFHDDIAALGVLPPTHEPRATDYIGPMIELIEKLIAKGNAYPADGHVLFDVTSMKDYGRLSRRSLDEMMAGARIDVAPYKRGDMDFVLWKPSDRETPGWDSPWGRGRPGWHIECSAMSWKHLGETFDIHGGGIDLVFPHHENELAQTRCVFGHNLMANIWMHNGFLQVEGQKMSKSLGNFVTINDLRKERPGDVLRLQMLMTHYRQPMDWTWTRNEIAREELHDWTSVLEAHEFLPSCPVDPQVTHALSDDLNTPSALTKVRELYNRAKDGNFETKGSFASTLKFLGFKNVYSPGLFESGVQGKNVGNAGLFIHLETVDRLRAAYANGAPERVIAALNDRLAQGGLSVNILRGKFIQLEGKDNTIENLISARLEARKAKNWAESDRIRDELASMGIAIKDNKDGTTTWEVRR